LRKKYINAAKHSVIAKTKTWRSTNSFTKNLLAQ